ncbi:MAG: sensor histidine kinase [Kiloniellaceae bacterium]
MKLPRLARGRAPFFVIILLFGVSLAFSFHALLQQQLAQQLKLSDNLWLITQLEVEYLRFLDAFDRFALADPSGEADEAAGRRELRRRLDVLWSRIPLLLTGEEGRQFKSIVDVQDMARDLDAMFRVFEPAIVNIAPGDAEAYATIRERLEAPTRRIHANVRRAFVADENETAFRNAELRQAYVMLAGSLVGILMSGSLFIKFLTRQVSMVKSAEARTREAMYRAEAANHAKTEFLASMSHELRTPLNAIIGFAEILKQEMFGPIQNPRYLEYVEDIEKSGSHLLAVISDILDLAKIESGKVRLEEQRVHLAEVVALAARIVWPEGVQTGLTVELKIAPDLPLLRGDRRLIRQMVLNLLSNAAKFTPAGGTVTVEVGMASDGRPMIRILDTGIGMASEDISTALQPFGQLAPVGIANGGGTGLGLPLAKAFADLHGAELLVDSRPGCGTVVTLLFPPHRIVDREDAA